MLFSDNDQQNKYHQVWKEILKIINRENGEIKLHEKIRLFDIDLPIEHVFKILSIIITVIRSLIEKKNILFRTFIKPLYVRNQIINCFKERIIRAKH